MFRYAFLLAPPAAAGAPKAAPDFPAAGLAAAGPDTAAACAVAAVLTGGTRS